MSKVEKRVDVFLPILQRLIHTRQEERKYALIAVEECDREIAILEAERDRRINADKIDFRIPDFPPIEESAAKDEPGDTREEVEDAQRDAEEEAIDHQVEVFFDNSEFATPGHTIFGPFPGINQGIRSKAFKEASLKVVRTWVVNWGQDWFTSGDVKRDTGFSPTIVRDRLATLLEMGTILHNGQIKRASKFKFNSAYPKGPTEKPRGERVPAGVGAQAAGRGSTVAYTGRVPGSSGKPGQDKKKSQAQGRRVGRGRQVRNKAGKS